MLQKTHIVSNDSEGQEMRVMGPTGRGPVYGGEGVTGTPLSQEIMSKWKLPVHHSPADSEEKLSSLLKFRRNQVFRQSPGL